MKKRVAILGSTGSIGTQALEIIAMFPDLLEAEVLTACGNPELLIRQAKQYKPNAVVIGDEQHYQLVKDALWEDDIKVFSGADSISGIVEMDSVDMVLSAIVGVAGLEPVYRALEYGKPVALANKETLVVAGELMMEKASQNRVPVIPVDSEHSAIFQALTGEFHNPVEKLIITASGGPFRGKDAAFLEQVTPEQALCHPNWNMGRKITIDSATLMNKGLEVIEAKWLFNMPLERIEVVIHPQSVIHSMVMFGDGSVKAQMGLPDMKLPIQYAFSYPERWINDLPRFEFKDYPVFTFEEPDRQLFPCLDLAYQASSQGGNMPCILNAANEIAVSLFLKGKISFTAIPSMIEKALSEAEYSRPASVEEYMETDRQCRELLLRIF